MTLDPYINDSCPHSLHAALVDSTSMFSLSFERVLGIIRSTNAIDLAAGLAAILALRMAYLANHKGPRTTRLRGPKPGIFFGADKVIFGASDPVAVYEAWYKEYGAVYEVPLMLGQRKVILCDPKSIAHFFGRDSWSYVLTPENKITVERTVCAISMYFTSLSSQNIQVGRGVLWADGEIHRR